MESSSHTIQQKKEMKGSRAGKEEMKVSLFRDDIIIYNESAKTLQTQLQDLQKVEEVH